uniref:Uncharacterized protein n=1 Tax=Anguilla anguilla TaxID=7936 RepID=A0A0E9SET1_ANGAN
MWSSTNGCSVLNGFPVSLEKVMSEFLLQGNLCVARVMATSLPRPYGSWLYDQSYISTSIPGCVQSHHYCSLSRY